MNVWLLNSGLRRCRRQKQNFARGEFMNARRCKGQFMELVMHSSQDLHVSATSTVNQVLNSMPE